MMIARRSLLGGALALAGAFYAGVALTGSARAGGPPAPFDAQSFEAAQKADKPILVEITAPWCPACAAQRPIIERLRALPRFDELQIFTIDFDTQKELMRRFGATLQSTLIGFKGPQEIGRSIGETQSEWIESLLDKTL
ncbi:thioredoxin family protein [Methylocella silvestris]|uniref:Thiol reductase thioredoxin n=1 Tax=Methylocella silvestris TaxID=199596 RepID=A0A2J7TKX2_METSI|nr:thioredoxin family protein [Methylocella silvestris]PNG27418.1 thiol reductase thioredoxin [Methylocella silvestris]